MKQKDVLKKVWKYLEHYRMLILLSFLFSIAVVVLTLYVPILVGRAIDQIVETGVHFGPIKGYLFATDNGGHLMCLDLNTLQLVWVQDTLDDSNSTPILSNENGHLYLYTSTSFRLGWRSNTTATVPIWKIDAETGEVIEPLK